MNIRLSSINVQNKSWIFKVVLYVLIPLSIIIFISAVFIVNYVSRRNTVTTGLDTQIDREISPWTALAESSDTPSSPTIEELDEKYKAVHESIEVRDYDLFKTVASTERIWHVENPKKLVNESSEGLPVYELLEPRGISNFVKYAPHSILLNAPKYEDIFPIQILDKTPSSRSDMLVVDPRTNEVTKVNLTVWPKAVELVYRTNIDNVDIGTGYIGFVWDGNDWKYNGERWQITPHKEPTTLGDTRIDSVEVALLDGSCMSESTTIKAGQAVQWRGISGRVYGISPNEYWDSGTLYGDNFVKQFRIPGRYEYLIQQPPRQPQDAKMCTVVVE